MVRCTLFTNNLKLIELCGGVWLGGRNVVLISVLTIFQHLFAGAHSSISLRGEIILLSQWQVFRVKDGVRSTSLKVTGKQRTFWRRIEEVRGGTSRVPPLSFVETGA